MAREKPGRDLARVTSGVLIALAGALTLAWAGFLVWGAGRLVSAW